MSQFCINIKRVFGKILEWLSIHYRVFLIGFFIVLLFDIVLYIEIVYYMINLDGQSNPDLSDNIVFTNSLYQDVVQSIPSTSISEFSSETLRGMVSLLGLTISTSFILVFMSIIALKQKYIDKNLKITCVVNAIGYAFLLLVGVFCTSPPTYQNIGPRRDFNIFFIWTISTSVSRVFHLIGAAVYLLVPSISTCLYLFKYYRKSPIQFPHHDIFVLLYGLAITLDVLLLITQGISIEENANIVLDAVWILLELFSFGGNSIIFFFFQYEVLHIHYRVFISRKQQQVQLDKNNNDNDNNNNVEQEKQIVRIKINGIEMTVQNNNNNHNNHAQEENHDLADDNDDQKDDTQRPMDKNNEFVLDYLQKRTEVIQNT